MRRRASFPAIAMTLCLAGCSAEDGPDPDAERTFVIPFAPYLGTQRVECGGAYSGAGVTGADFELSDFLAFVHGIELVREGGERVPLQLIDDQQWQGRNVALLDFNDATGRCAGDEETNSRVVGTAPDHDDYVGLAFDVGLPPELNHLEAVSEAAPFNKPSTWWSWKAGYKFFQMTLSTEAHESYFVHLGSTACEDAPDGGYTCAGNHRMAIEVPDFVPGKDGVRINLSTLLAEVDLNAPVDFASGDFVAGCMSFDPDPECDPLFSKFGIHFMSEDPGPQQIVFECDEDVAFDAAEVEDPDSTPQPGSDAFVRDPALDVVITSEAGIGLSHPAGDRYQIGSRTYKRGAGQQCMACHQPKGPGRGLFQIAGSVWNPDGSAPYADAMVKILPVFAAPCSEFDEREHCEGQPVGAYREEDVVATLRTDPHGNFYTTELPPEAQPPFWPVVEPAADDTELSATAMGHPAASGSCNMCHGTFQVRLGTSGG